VSAARALHDTLAPMIIRPEAPPDSDAISRVVTAAFGRADEARVVERIRASGHYLPALALVADDGERLVGHVMTSYVTVEGDDRRYLELAPVSVTPDRQRSGIGIAMIEETLRLADAMDAPFMLVFGHAEYYPRFGFESARAHGIEPPDARTPDAVWMLRPLRTYSPPYSARIIFPPAFDDP